MYDVEEENRTLKKELSQTKADCDNMLKIMEDNETELSSLKKREKMVNALSEEA